MKTASIAAALLAIPSIASAQTPTTPSLWQCITKTKIECRGDYCEPAPNGSFVRLDLVSWSYERCSEGCFGGQSNEWMINDGKLNVMSMTTPQILTVRGDNTFTDLALVHDSAFISNGECEADYSNGDEQSDASLIESWAAWNAWQIRMNAR